MISPSSNPKGKFGGLILFRKLAKTEHWRTRYNLSVATRIPLFSGPISQWSNSLVEFVSWCAFYYNISKLDDCPSENIIQSDADLDLWLRKRELNIKKQALRDKHERLKSSSGNKGVNIFDGLDEIEDFHDFTEEDNPYL